MGLPLHGFPLGFLSPIHSSTQSPPSPEAVGTQTRHEKRDEAEEEEEAEGRSPVGSGLVVG